MNQTYSNDDESIHIVIPPKKITQKLKKEKDNNIIIPENTFNYQDYIIYIIFFVILNISFTIETIYLIHNLKSLNSPYPNLIIRTLIFGLLIYLYKKYY